MEELISRLVKIARRHGKGCGELAEGDVGEVCMCPPRMAMVCRVISCA